MTTYACQTDKTDISEMHKYFWTQLCKTQLCQVCYCAVFTSYMPNWWKCKLQKRILLLYKRLTLLLK